MFNAFFGDTMNGRMSRLPFLIYSLILDLIVFVFGLLIAIVTDTFDDLMSGELKNIEDMLGQPLTTPYVVVFGLFTLLILFCAMNMTAKRFRDIGLPGWVAVLSLIGIEAIVSIMLSQQNASGLHFLVWVALVLIPGNILPFAKAPPIES
ncbi:MAG: DUF805 domain-containing protein [Gammaproteobacteria bacterium]